MFEWWRDEVELAEEPAHLSTPWPDDAEVEVDDDPVAGVERWLQGRETASYRRDLALTLTETPGPRVAVALAELVDLAGPEDLLPAELTDAQVVEVVAAAERLSRHLSTIRGRGLRELTARWTGHNPLDTNTADLDPDRRRFLRKVKRRQRPLAPVAASSDQEAQRYDLLERELLAEAFVVAETALATGVTEHTAGTWARVATALANDRYPLTAAGLQTGRLDWAKTTLITDTLDDRDEHIRRLAEQIVVPDALTGPRQTLFSTTALKERLHAVLLLIDPPTDQDTGHQHDGRRVWHRATTPGMGELIAALPTDQIALIMARLDAAVTQARTDRDPRTAAQVRADTLTDLLIHGHHTDDPADGALTNDNAEEATHDGTAEDQPPAPAPGAGAGPGAFFRPGPPPVQVQVQVTITLETLLGLRDDPAYLQHYGPIAAALARELAATATFRCAITDDTHGTILGLGRPTFRTGYTPGTRLQDLMRTSWERCAFPGCRTRITKHAPTSSDLDHVDPWPHGPTCSCNTQPLCRRHHNLKTHGKLTLEPSTDPHDPPGSWHWRLPTGHTHTSTPPAPTPHITTRPPPNTPDPGDDPPPF